MGRLTGHQNARGANVLTDERFGSMSDVSGGPSWWLVSCVRARALFMVLDAVAVVASYGVAEVSYFIDSYPPNRLQREGP
jgi:hypothetical protein